MGFSRTYSYDDVPTLRAFNASERFYRVIIGPFGSGKSSGCVAEIIDRGMRQAPGPDGVRRTRGAVVRNTYSQLYDTTMKTVKDWLPVDIFGEENITNHRYTINKIKLEDGTSVEIELLFRALDKPEHVRNLLSLELTWAWFNELREIPKAISDAMEGRVGRYPSVDNGGCTWRGIFADTNPPDTDSWIYKLFEEKVPKDPILAQKYEIFKQPSGRSPKAENLKYLADDYYTLMAIGKDPEFVKVYIDGEYGYTRDGKPVFPNFSDTMHVSTEDLQPIKGVPVIVGMDFALNPSAVFCQYLPDGRFHVFKEMCEEDMGLRRFLMYVMRPYITNNLSGFEIYITGDPAGVQRGDTDERSCFEELRSQGLPATPAPTNSLLARYNAVDFYLTKLIEGKGAFQLSPSCVILRKGFIGEYRLKRFHGVNDRFSEVPIKNQYSHVQDALQYACMMADKASQMISVGYGVFGSSYTPVLTPRPSMTAWT